MRGQAGVATPITYTPALPSYTLPLRDAVCQALRSAITSGKPMSNAALPERVQVRATFT